MKKLKTAKLGEWAVGVDYRLHFRLFCAHLIKPFFVTLSNSVVNQFQLYRCIIIIYYLYRISYHSNLINQANIEVYQDDMVFGRNPSIAEE